jgi:hypothetical protein
MARSARAIRLSAISIMPPHGQTRTSLSSWRRLHWLLLRQRRLRPLGRSCSIFRAARGTCDRCRLSPSVTTFRAIGVAYCAGWAPGIAGCLRSILPSSPDRNCGPT